MATDQDWEKKIGRRLRLRDLHVVFTVADCGNMAKAAASLRVTQAAVSQMIADVEQELGVRLFDSSRWPGVVLEVETFAGDAAAAKLRDRSIDLVFARDGPGLNSLAAEDFKITKLFEDRLSVVVGSNSRWAGIRQVDLTDLADAPWIILPYGWGKEVIPKAFGLRGLPPPRIALKTSSIHLRLHLLATGKFVSALPASVLRLHQERFNLKELRIDLPKTPYAVAIVTLKNRTLSPVVDHFIRSTATRFEKPSRHGAKLSPPPI
jgi:DNA-binding transcriptional LysR family regulator